VLHVALIKLARVFSLLSYSYIYTFGTVKPAYLKLANPSNDNDKEFFQKKKKTMAKSVMLTVIMSFSRKSHAVRTTEADMQQCMCIAMHGRRRPDLVRAS
jgi:hypothetical protein